MRYALKTPWRDGTTHVEFAPLDFLARLAALVPPPRAHLTRFHGVFAPNANLRAQFTPSGRGKRAEASTPMESTTEHEGEPTDHRTPAEKRAAMTWAQRLKRVFGIDVKTCAHCGGAVRIVAAVEESSIIRQILDHFDKHGALPQAHYRPAARAAACRGGVMASRIRCAVRPRSSGNLDDVATVCRVVFGPAQEKRCASRFPPLPPPHASANWPAMPPAARTFRSLRRFRLLARMPGKGG